jgi:rhodanese-related sulfurtransferase
MAGKDLVSAAEAHKGVGDGSALLVCAYDSDEKFQRNHLEGGISLSDFKNKAGELSKDQKVIFYCA